MQHWQKESLVAMVTVSIGTIIIPKMQANSLAFQSVSQIHMRDYIRMSYWTCPEIHVLFPPFSAI